VKSVSVCFEKILILHRVYYRRKHMGITLQKVSKIYSTGDVETVALKEVDLEITEGEIIVLLGPSGSGKSTLLNVCSGLDKPTSGTITIEGDVISDMDNKQLTKFRRENLGFIFQQYNRFFSHI
jgi:putative ABC transport system ATP-binding protein